MFNKDNFKRLIKTIDEYSPHKYSFILILPAVALTTGFLVWNIYLYSLGFIENDLIRSRFLITGASFILISYLLYPILKLFLKLFLISFRCLKEKITLFFSWIRNLPKEEPNQKKAKTPKKKLTTYCFLFFFWMLIYSVLIFPRLPLIIGGGQPRAISLIMNEENIKQLVSLQIKLTEGGPYQTENVCVAYESTENIIIMRNDRVLSFKKSLIEGFGSLPGKRSEFEQTCVAYATTWSYRGLILGLLLPILSILNFFFNIIDINLHLALPY